MKYNEFLEVARLTNIEEKQYFLLWRTWRFELSTYMSDVLNEFTAINPKCKNVREMFRSENNIGIILKKYRKMRIVSVEGIKDKLYNMGRILANCDVNQGETPKIIYFPLVYIRCPECFATVKKMSCEGVWHCVCGYEWIDAFYNVKEISRIRGVVDTTTPKENIDKIEKELPF